MSRLRQPRRSGEESIPDIAGFADVHFSSFFLQVLDESDSSQHPCHMMKTTFWTTSGVLHSLMIPVERIPKRTQLVARRLIAQSIQKIEIALGHCGCDMEES